MLCDLSYWALELHGSVATWPSLPWKSAKLMMLFQLELGWSVLELLGWSTDSGCRAPLQK